MKVIFNSLKLKKRKDEKRKKIVDKFYKKSSVFELLSIKLYEKTLKKISRKNKNGINDSKIEILKNLISQDKKHLMLLEEKTLKTTRINFLYLMYHYFINSLFGITFSLRMLEKIEEKLLTSYSVFLSNDDIIIKHIATEEKEHLDLISKICDENKLEYVSIVVLGLNDAIVEMSAAIAGYTFALNNLKVVYIISLITGISAAMSMAASSFISARQTKDLKPFKALFLTGVSYLFTVFILTLPYLVLKNKIVSISLMFIFAIIIIFLFNFYMSIAKKQSLKRNFFTMAGIAIFISALSFGLGILINKIGIIKN